MKARAAQPKMATLIPLQGIPKDGLTMSGPLIQEQ
jgi:hypothetical protein